MDALVSDLNRAGRTHPEARLDEPGDQGQGAGEAGQVHGQDRLSGQVARLFRPAVAADDLYGNAPGPAFEWNRDCRLNGPVDKQEWGMTPQTVNAYYNPPNNEIVFPAAILQAPFFDPNADPAVNYGGIGGVIGHEMTHGFDDQGRKSDGDGVLTDWWTPEDAAKFKVQADRWAPSTQLRARARRPRQGRLTMGENIADLGGLLWRWTPTTPR